MTALIRHDGLARPAGRRRVDRGDPRSGQWVSRLVLDDSRDPAIRRLPFGRQGGACPLRERCGHEYGQDSDRAYCRCSHPRPPAFRAVAAISGGFLPDPRSAPASLVCAVTPTRSGGLESLLRGSGLPGALAVGGMVPLDLWGVKTHWEGGTESPRRSKSHKFSSSETTAER